MSEQSAKERFLAQFERVSQHEDALAPLRRDALARFRELGLPTRHQEDWKYTSVRQIEQNDFELPADTLEIPDDLARREGVPGLDAARLVFVNGRYSESLSHTEGLPDGVSVRSLAQAIGEAPERVREDIARQSGLDFSGFTALNTAFVEDGAVLEVAANTAVENPIELLFLSVAGDQSRYVFHPRVLIRMGQGAEATVLEHHAGVNGASNFNNAVTEITLDDQARLEHYRIQRESTAGFHIGSVHVDQGRASRYVNHNINLGGALVRNDINSRLSDVEAEAVFNGLYLVSNKQHVDNHTCVDHASPHTYSDELYKGVLDGKGKAVFNGRVKVHPDAQKIEAHQKNDNLLLSKLAEIDTKPELEIYADDVICSHGATVGQIDRGALFYLRSRGIDEAKARDLLTYAFAESVIERMPLAAVREWLEGLVVNRISGEGLLDDLETEGE